MKKFLLFSVVCCALLSCGKTPTADEPNAIHIIPLYPSFTWSEPNLTSRVLTFDSTEVEVYGYEISTETIDGERELFDPESLFPDEDLWKYYLDNDQLRNLGYDTVFMNDEKYDRHLFGIHDDRGHVFMLSDLIEFETQDPQEPDCPCDYTFVIFSNDPRILLE